MIFLKKKKVIYFWVFYFFIKLIFMKEILDIFNICNKWYFLLIVVLFILKVCFNIRKEYEISNELNLIIVDILVEFYG